MICALTKPGAGVREWRRSPKARANPQGWRDDGRIRIGHEEQLHSDAPARNARRNPARCQAFFPFTLTRHHEPESRFACRRNAARTHVSLQEVLYFAQDIVGETVHDAEPFAVIARQIVSEQDEDHDYDPNDKHILSKHGSSVARKALGGERLRRPKVQRVRRDLTQPLRRHLPVLAEDDGELGDFFDGDFAAAGGQQADVGLVDLVWHQPLWRAEADGVASRNPLH